jgi:hypothetical protein
MTCPKCKSQNRPGARFCKQCGGALPAGIRPAPPEPAAPPVSVHIEGHVNGPVAIGKNILQIGDVHGGVVNVMMPGQEVQPKPYPTPIDMRPPPFPDLLNRQKEIETATKAFQSSEPVEFRGLPGIGKTSLLQHLAHHPITTSFPDGVVFLSAKRRSLDYLLQAMHDAFYESRIPFIPTEAQLRHALQGRRALIFLDDVGLAREDAQALMSMAPNCVFVMTSPDRRLWGQGQSMALPGLPLDDAITLIERELGHSLTPDEQPAAHTLHNAARGHPWTLLRVAAETRRLGRPLHETFTLEDARSAVGTAEELPDQARQLLATLAAMGGAPIHSEHLAALSGLPDVTAALQTLSTLRLAQAHSPRYSLTGDLEQALQQAWDLTPWMERGLAHFAKWARGQRTPDRLLEEADAILHVLQWAAGAGHWRSVLRLGGALERALALGKRWSEWRQVLGCMHQAALALDDKAAEAWALHQLGTRSLCLGKQSAARAALNQALKLREALGDQAGAAITKHNLGLLAPPPAPPREGPPKPRSRPRLSRWILPLAGLGTVAAIVAVIAAVIILPIIWPPWPPTPETPTATKEPTKTPTPTPSPTPDRQGPDAPILLTPEDGYEIVCEDEGGFPITLYWEPVDDASGIAYYEVDVARWPESVATNTESPLIAYDDQREIIAECSDWFEWRVRAVDEEQNEGAWSEEWSFRVLTWYESDTQPPPVPNPKTPGTETEGSPESSNCPWVLTWDSVEDVTDVTYEIVVEYEGGTGVWNEVDRQDNLEATTTESIPECGEYTKYRWRVRAHDGAGNVSGWSKWLYIRTPIG